MNLKKLRAELEKAQTEKQKQELTKQFAEQKTTGCGRWVIFIFLVLIMFAVLCGLVALVKLLLGYIF